MISLYSEKLEADLKAWTAMVSARFELLGQRSKSIVLKRQAGLLARTLINISPPKNKRKTEENIKQRVTGKFALMGESHGHEWASVAQGSLKSGHGDTRWYAFSKWAIYGVSKSVDFTNASVDQLYMLYFGQKRNKQGRIKRQRGKQTVYILQRIVTSPDTVKALIKRIIRHIGRLKAGWAVSWKDAGAPGTALPAYVSNNLQGARGYSISLLGDQSSPSFTIVNTAKGVNSEAVEIAARAALQIRLKAMANDVAFAIKKPGEWSEREARAEAAIETV